ncbi:hypothetical protein X729_09720 [Mesorhizobium sp. L103C131B0]|nr:hypothetical protein X761_02995 [Mesorhizobium sp. LSHC424B00]ESZ50883.1 hypothetical protein X730_07250 [Mesorhizobium sp. L103C565B0]ESZ63253.1 hypothetical protein X729_09720 [Mesorhizobium sp. L103C131B0]ESZ67258.1 hypothetical protein X728_02085 [Mesorhizobium sp. L103C120A0]
MGLAGRDHGTLMARTSESAAGAAIDLLTIAHAAIHPMP